MARTPIRLVDGLTLELFSANNTFLGQIYVTATGEVAIAGSGGGAMILGDVGSACDLEFEESSRISGQGTNTITVGVSGDTFNLAVSGVIYQIDLSTAGSIFIMPVSSAAPGSPSEGQMYFDSDDHTPYIYNGTGWVTYSGYSGVSGFSAWSGYSGVSGWSGESAWSGTSGFSGESAWSGYSGISGWSAWSGVSGFSAWSGVSGFSAWSGYSAYSGVSGYSGKSGFSAWSGVSGYSGISGFSSQSGFSGISGWSGENPGASGTSGYSGVSGFSGYDAQAGYSGPSGWSGYSGVSGYSGAYYNIQSITNATDTYTILNTDQTVICSKATPFTVTLPTTTLGIIFYIVNIGVGTVTVDGDSTDLINGYETISLGQWESIQVQCYVANNWTII